MTYNLLLPFYFLLADSLDDSLNSILDKLKELFSAFWPFLVGIVVAAAAVWFGYIGIRYAIAHRNEEQINVRNMLKNAVIGILIIFVAAMAVPLLIGGLMAWAGA